MPSFYAPQLYRQVLPRARIVSCKFGEFLADNIVRFTNLLTYLLSYMGMRSVCLSVCHDPVRIPCNLLGAERLSIYRLVP